jgi:DNA polymerase III subunit gamma/tau
LQFNLKLLSVEQIERQLARILDSEGVESDPPSLHLIAVAADGSLRDALSLLDQAISYGGGRLVNDQVRTMLGTINNIELSALLDALISGDAGAVMQQVDRMAEHDPDYDAVLVELLSMLQKVAVCQLFQDETDSTVHDSDLREKAKRIGREDVQLYYQMGLMGRRDMAFAPDPRSGFEMTLIRILAFRPASPVSIHDHGIPAVESKQPLADARHNRSPQDNTGSPGERGTVTPDDWQDIIDEMALVGLVKELAGHCILKEHTKEKIHLVLSPAQEHLLNTAQKERLHAALKTRFGNHIKVIITVEDPGAETPVQKKTREEKEKQLAAEKSVESDPNIKDFQDLFDAVVDRDSIRPNNN